MCVCVCVCVISVCVCECVCVCVCVCMLTMALAQGLDFKKICLKIILVSLGAVCIGHKSLKVSRLTGT